MSTEQAPQETPEQTIARAQAIINSLRSHLQSATDALVATEAENTLLREQIKAHTAA